MTPEEKQKKTELEQQINEEFSQLQQKLGDLKAEVQAMDGTKKQEKNKKIQEMESELSDIGVGKGRLERMSSLQEQELLSLKTRLESLKNTIQKFSGEVSEVLTEKVKTPTTYELLRGSETTNRLINIISSNPKKFKDIPGDSAEKKLENIFKKISEGITLFMKNKLGDSQKYNEIIDQTIVPAFEWNLLEMLRDNGNKTNVDMLECLNKISRDNIKKLINGISHFAKKTRGSYNKFSQWINALDYLSVHNGVLDNPRKSEVLTSPIKFQKYLNDPRFTGIDYSPYKILSGNIFEVDENKDFKFGISLQEKQEILSQIGNIQVVNNPKTTALITKMLDKPKEFLECTGGLQETANGLLDGISSINSITKIFGVDILGEITKLTEEKSFKFRILDFVCKFIGITGGLEGIVKKWRLERMNLTDEKSKNIKQIFEKYKELDGESVSLSITDSNSCKEALKNFEVSDTQGSSTTKGDHLRDSIASNMDIGLVSPAVVQQTLGDSYLKNGQIDTSKISDNEKLLLAHRHLQNMRNHLEKYNSNSLQDFYNKIHSTEDLALCITASLYVDKDDVIEGIKANVFLPENYGTVISSGAVDSGNDGGNDNGSDSYRNNGSLSLSELTSSEKSELQTLLEQSKTPNNIKYLENVTYKKYLNIIERELNLPRYSLECVCYQESKGILYRGNNIIGSNKGAKGLFQFIDSTSDTYMKHSKLKEKYGKTFNSRDEFLRDPLASAWAAGILLYSEFINKYNYNFQSALACYNCGAGNYQKKIGKNGENLTTSNFGNLSKETKEYVENITKNIMQRNGISGSDFLSVDLLKCLWNSGAPEVSESNSEFLIGPKLLAKNRDEIGGLGNSIMNGIQGVNNRSNFPNMDGVIGKNTQTHPHRFNSKDDVLAYKNSHPNIKSFMFYFGANSNNNQKTISDITQRSEWMKEVGIQPVLSTCVGENSTETPRLKELNQQIIALGKNRNWSVIDFDKSYKKGDITMGADGVHPTSYSAMIDIINSLLSQK